MADTVISEKTKFVFTPGHFYTIISTIVAGAVMSVVMWYNMRDKISETNKLQNEALWRTLELMQIELKYQGQVIWEAPENAYLRSVKNEEINEKFAEFARKSSESVYRESSDSPFKFKLEN